MIDREKLIKDIRVYADLKCANGETELANGILKTLSIIKEQPEANRWIPVSERLPDKAGAYLVTNNMEKARKLDITDYHSDIEIMYFSLKHRKFRTNSIVIAWKPLPEPWKEEKSEII